MVQNLHILLLEDEEIVSRVLSQMLEHLGCTAVITTTGEDAIDAYRDAMNHTPFNLVITDLTILGGMDGAEAATEILKIDPSATIVVSSGLSSEALSNNYDDIGFKAVLKKPYRINELETILNELTS